MTLSKKPEKKNGFEIAEFILKLAEARNLEDDKATDAIYHQYKIMAHTPDYPNACGVFDEHSAYMKRLDERARKRIRQGCLRYDEEMAHEKSRK